MKVPRSRIRSASTLLAVAILAMVPARSASSSVLNIVPSFPTLTPGAQEQVSVVFTSSQAFTLAAADIEIAYDSTRFSVSNVMTGTLDANFTNGTNAGTAGYVLGGFAAPSATTGTAISIGTSGTLETFTLTALANAPIGGATGDINLLAESPFGFQTSTAVYDNSGSGIGIVLTPPPSDGLDSNDGTVLIVGGTVPEPSSLILMGLGGGSIVVASRFRKKARRPSSA